MKLNLDSHSVDIACPSCGKKQAHTIGRLKAHPDVSCPCGATIKVNLEKFDKGIAEAQKSIDDFQATLRKLSKR